MLIFLPILIIGGPILMYFSYILALIALKELLNMNKIRFISIPGIISALGLIIIMLPHDLGAWVAAVQLKGLI
ncbi:MAG: phosphatidate cytidylyltransferase, partial [Staphylococcus carnosus]